MADAHILELFADIAMLALSHVSLYDEVRALNRRLERRVRERTQALHRSTVEIARKSEQLEELLAGIGQTQNEERGRIAQDIHDGVMQTLTGAVYELKALETLDSDSSGALTPRPAQHPEAAPPAGGGASRRHPGPATRRARGRGLAAAIEAEARELRSRFGIACLVKVMGRRRRLPEPIEVAALRIVKEALGNAQHLAPRRTPSSVEVRFRRRDVEIVVRDDGAGFDPAASNDARPHLGISGMRRRAEAIGGTFSLESAPGARHDARRDAADRGVPMSAPIRVLVVDDHAVVSRGIRSLLAQYADLEVVAVASSSEEALALVASSSLTWRWSTSGWPGQGRRRGSTSPDSSGGLVRDRGSRS